MLCNDKLPDCYWSTVASRSALSTPLTQASRQTGQPLALTSRGDLPRQKKTVRSCTRSQVLSLDTIRGLTSQEPEVQSNHGPGWKEKWTHLATITNHSLFPHLPSLIIPPHTRWLLLPQKDSPGASCWKATVHTLNTQSKLFCFLRPLWLCKNNVSAGILCFPECLARMIEQGCLHNGRFNSKDFKYPGG